MKIISILLFLSALAAPASSQLFDDGFYIPCGIAPVKVIAAELDGQPGIDLVMADDAAGAISILLNQGDGTFGTPTIISFDPAVGTYTLCAGDLDGDLDNDLVVGHGTTFSVLANDGAAGFTSGPTLPTNGYWIARETCAADIDGDGNVDLIWGEPNLGGGLWLAMNEGETFATPVELFHSHVSDPVVANFDGDSHLDIAFQRSAQEEVVVLLGLGDGTFQAPVSYTVPASSSLVDLAANDLDGDTDVDLIVLDGNYSAYVWLLTNLGDGTFGAITNLFSTPPNGGPSVIALDLDGSGCGDVVSVGQWRDVEINDCVGEYTQENPDPIRTTRDVAATDLDGDGDLDLVFAASGVDSVLVNLNTRFEVSAAPDDLPGSRLVGCYPNPFNPQTTIEFELRDRAAVDLRVFDLSGRTVRSLLAETTLNSGRHLAVWNGRDDAGLSVASGIYFYRLEAGDYSETKRMVHIK